MPIWLRRFGSTRARTAGFAPPPTNTWPMPSTCESFCARIESAASYMRPTGMTSEISVRIRMGASAGFTLRYVGLFGSVDGSWLRAALMAACTSRAAASMFRLRSNCRTIRQLPSRLVDVISVTPAMRPNWRSSGVATAEAIVSGLAPGSAACTLITGYSTWGRGATGSIRYAMIPASSRATLMSVVPMGRRMKGSEMFMGAGSIRRLRQRCGLGLAALEALGEPVEREVDDRCGVEREELGEEQSADDCDTERAAQLGAGAGTEGQRQPAEERGHGRHDDGARGDEAR